MAPSVAAAGSASSSGSPPASPLIPTGTASGGGGSTAAASAVVTYPPQPEDAIPSILEQRLSESGQKDTGKAYAAECEKFLNFLRSQGLNFGTMPPGTADHYLKTVVSNPTTRNKVATALERMFEVARTAGLPHHQQVMERTSRRKAPQAPQGGIFGVTPATASAPTNVVPGGPPPVPPANLGPAVTPVVQQANINVPPPAPPLPVIPPQQGTLPSLGKRWRLCRIADSGLGGMALGNEIHIGVYYEKQFDDAGGLAHFIARYIRPTYGPFPAPPGYPPTPPAVYRIQLLNNAGVDMPGHRHDVNIGPDPHAPPQTPTAAAAASAYPAAFATQYGSFSSAAPTVAPAFDPMGVMMRIVDRAEARYKDDSEDYRRRKEELEAKHKAGQIDQTSLMLLVRELRQPQPPDPAELRRQLREEMETFQRMNPPPPVAPMPILPIEPAKPDPMIEAMVKSQERLMDFLLQKFSQPPPAAPPQQDPLETYAKMVALMKGTQEKDPILEKLALMTLSKMEAPEKPKGLADVFTELEMLQKFKALIGGGESTPPTIAEQFIELLGVGMENADKIGSMFEKMRGGGLASALHRGRQISSGQAEQAQQKEQAWTASAPVKTKLIELCQACETKADDDTICQRLFAVLEQLNDEAKQGNEVAGKIVATVKAKFVEAESRTDIHVAVVKFFDWCSAKAIRDQHPNIVERITDAVHRSYTGIYSLLTEGQVKVLKDAPIITTTPPSDVTATSAADGDAPAEATDPQSGSPEDEDDNENDEDEDSEGEDEEKNDAESPTAAAPVATAKPLAATGSK